MSKKGASKLSRFIRAPIRALRRARDFYIQSVTGCAGQLQYGPAVGYPSTPAATPSFSLGKDDDDLRELIRVASQRSLDRTRGESGPLKVRVTDGRGRTAVPRSRSVAVERIDEDQPCEFDNDDVSVGSDLLFPRSRSCALPARTRIGGGARLVVAS